MNSIIKGESHIFLLTHKLLTEYFTVKVKLNISITKVWIQLVIASGGIETATALRGFVHHYAALRLQRWWRGFSRSSVFTLAIGLIHSGVRTPHSCLGLSRAGCLVSPSLKGRFRWWFDWLQWLCASRLNGPDNGGGLVRSPAVTCVTCQTEGVFHLTSSEAEQMVLHRPVWCAGPIPAVCLRHLEVSTTLQ